ncbi:MAG TPA: hypothetical protein PK324_16345, partial [Nocardioides sp.]|nr:hypothetical protein [Nocardioides sp.]
VVLSSAALLAVAAVPLWLLAGSGSLLAMAAAQTLVGVGVGGVLSVATLAEQFPTRLRATGLALTAGLGTALLGGTGPLVDQILIRATGVDALPGVYAAIVAALALVAVYRLPETAGSELS